MPKQETPQEVSLDKDSKQVIQNAESTMHAVHEDLRDIGDEVDISKMTIEQLRKEFLKYRRSQELFRLEIRKVIADEVERQVKPLAEQISLLTTQKPKVVYVKLKLPFDNLGEKMYALLRNIWKVPQKIGNLIKKIGKGGQVTLLAFSVPLLLSILHS